MIFNRTQEDVDNANNIRETKVKQFATLTTSEITTLERGMLTYNTLNRIENKQEALVGLMNGMGYWNTPVVNKTWSRGDIFNRDDFLRILNNENILKKAFFVLKDTPQTPDVSFGFKDINAIEKILYDLDSMIDDIKSHYIECGDYECGE